MEAIGRCHEPVAAALHEIYVCVLNPLFIKQSGDGSIRKVKTDKADAMKIIAKYGLDNWVDPREYIPVDPVRQHLKLCICRVSEKAFTERYQKWCKRKGYHFSVEKAMDIYAGSCGHFTTLPKNDNAKLLITTAAQQLLTGKMTLAVLRIEMTRLAQQLPEYDTVQAVYGVGETTAAQLIAEIGDVRRFPRRSSIVGFAGIDPAVD